jgi:predicted nucleotidyltransferase
MKQILILLFLLSVYALASAIELAPFTSMPFNCACAYEGSTAWGDFDNDGDLDVLITGGLSFQANPSSRIFRNDNGNFVDINANLAGVFDSSTAWGDYDRDGDLDILLTGVSSSNNPITKIYRNDNGTFIDINANLSGVAYSAVAWGDYDNDGDLDIVLTGSTSVDMFYSDARTSKIYRNDNGNFVNINAPLIGVYFGSVAWGDFDKDGDLDLLLTGTTRMFPATSTYSRIYKNTNGSFIAINAGLTGILRGSAVWGDYDNDGDLDILMTGVSGGVTEYGTVNTISKIYRNDNSVFVDINAGLTVADENTYTNCSWGDYDNDGDLDVILANVKTTDINTHGKIYRNDNLSFVDIGTGIPGGDLNSSNWGDYDNDGDLDILIPNAVVRNDLNIANSAPSAPTNLHVTDNGTYLTFAWSASSDAQTPAMGLSYNLKIGTTPGGNEIASAMSNTGSYRQIVQSGYVNGDIHYTKHLNMPIMVGAGASYRFSDTFMMAGDYEFRQFSNSQFTSKSSDAPITRFDLQQVRFGLEYRLAFSSGYLPLRLGIQNYPTVYENSAEQDADRGQVIGTGFAAGTGISYKNLLVDVAATFLQYHRDYYFQDVGIGEIRHDDITYLATATYHFNK